MKKGSRKYNDPICTVEGCNKPYYARRLCHSHYCNFMRCGNPLGTRLPRVKCKHPNCERLSESKGYCSMHYYRNIHGRDMDAPLKHHKHIDRDKAIALMYEHDYTMESIGNILGITRERVRQILGQQGK